MKPVPLELYLVKFRVRHLDALGVCVNIKRGLHVQSCRSLGIADQVDHDFMTDKRLPAPIARDVVEKAVLDLVPLTGARWEMAHRD